MFRKLMDLLKGQAAPTARRAVEIGWFLDTEKASFIWEAPQRLRRVDPPAKHAKSVSYCPAALDLDARMFVVPCPIDARLRFARGENGQPVLRNMDGDEATIRNKHLGQMVAIIGQKEWRHPDRPIVQIITPYGFIADEQVYMSQLPAIEWYNPSPLPGTMITGRLPIHIWPRTMMWAFEWHDTSKDIVLKRGDPWFYVRFEANDPSRPIRFGEAELTPELKTYVAGLSAVANYVNKTFSLFKTAQARRPKTLLKLKGRKDQG